MGGRLSILLGWVRPHRLSLSLCASVFLWGLSLPPHGLSILAALAFVPVFIALPGEDPGRAAVMGWAAGLGWEFVTLWWLKPTLVNYGNMGGLTALALVVGMCAVLGLYMALFLGGLALLLRRWGDGALLLAPCLWVLCEWLRGTMWTGFPWWGPGYALSVYAALLQVTRLAGILGLSFLAVSASVALALWVRDRRRMAALVAVPTAMVLFLAAFLWGFWQSEEPIKPRPESPVGYLQPQIRQDVKWDPDHAGEIMGRLEKLSLAFKHYKLKLLVWPESSTPFEWDASEAFRQRVGETAHAIDAPILLGTVLAEEEGYKNGAVLVLPNGAEGGRYAKTHLVPFGEYVPMRSALFFARPIVDSVGDFLPGDSLRPLATPLGKVGVSICYEGIFPGLVRKEVKEGAEVLVNITNDAWYRGTPGPVQHYLQERVRAVENDRYLIRSANLGVSGVVDPRGRLQAATEPGQPASFWGLVEARTTKTLWIRVGNWWLMFPLILVISFLVPVWAGRGKRPHGP